MTAENFRIHAHECKETGQRILHVAGSLDSSTWPTLLAQVGLETAPMVILDMDGVERIDSQGIGALAKVNEMFKRKNRRLAVAGLTPRVKEMLQVTRVLPTLEVFATFLEAEDALVSGVRDSGQVN